MILSVNDIESDGTVVICSETKVVGCDGTSIDANVGILGASEVI